MPCKIDSLVIQKMIGYYVPDNPVGHTVGYPNLAFANMCLESGYPHLNCLEPFMEISCYCRLAIFQSEYISQFYLFLSLSKLN